MRLADKKHRAASVEVTLGEGASNGGGSGWMWMRPVSVVWPCWNGARKQQAWEIPPPRSGGTV